MTRATFGGAYVQGGRRYKLAEHRGGKAKPKRAGIPVNDLHTARVFVVFPVGGQVSFDRRRGWRRVESQQEHGRKETSRNYETVYSGGVRAASARSV